MGEKKGKVFVFGREGVGHGDDTMGYEILMNLLDTLGKREEKPAALIFWNMAVNLLVKGSPAVKRLKVLEDGGVRILAGRFCLTDLCIADTVAVGKGAGMDEILDVIMDHEVVSL